MVCIKTVNGTVQFDTDDKGWNTVPSGGMILDISEDRLTASLKGVNTDKYDVQNYPIKYIFNCDDPENEIQFDADTLELYLINAGFFRKGAEDVEIIDNLDSTDSDKALSANQGNRLNGHEYTLNGFLIHTITHNKNKHVQVQVLNLSGFEFSVIVQEVNLNTVRILSLLPLQGTAIIY